MMPTLIMPTVDLLRILCLKIYLNSKELPDYQKEEKNVKELCNRKNCLVLSHLKKN